MRYIYSPVFFQRHQNHEAVYIRIVAIAPIGSCYLSRKKLRRKVIGIRCKGGGGGNNKTAFRSSSKGWTQSNMIFIVISWLSTLAVKKKKKNHQVQEISLLLILMITLFIASASKLCSLFS